MAFFPNNQKNPRKKIIPGINLTFIYKIYLLPPKEPLLPPPLGLATPTFRGAGELCLIDGVEPRNICVFLPGVVCLGLGATPVLFLAPPKLGLWFTFVLGFGVTLPPMGLLSIPGLFPVTLVLEGLCPPGLPTLCGLGL